MPLSSSPRIDRDEIIELLEESFNRLPDELRQARWMLKERQDFVAKTRREADELLEAARVCVRNGWCSAPRSCVPPNSAPARSWTPQKRTHVA